MRFPRLPALARAETGFTLLEVLIATTIMLIAFTSIYSVQSSSIFATERAKRMNIVGMLARKAMNETEIEIKGKKFQEIKEEESNQFEDPYQDYSWTRRVKEVKFPDITSMMKSSQQTNANGQPTADKDDGSAAMMETVTKVVQGYLSKALREVSISVGWKTPKGEQSYTVTMYWVDMNVAMELSP